MPKFRVHYLVKCKREEIRDLEVIEADTSPLPGDSIGQQWCNYGKPLDSVCNTCVYGKHMGEGGPLDKIVESVEPVD